MERENLKLVSRVLVIAIALTMVLPVSSVFLGQSETAIPEMDSQSTTIRFTHAGLEFDNTAGEPALPANMKAANNDKYIVQFKGPIMSEWKQELRDLGAKVHQYVEDYAYVVEMDNAVKANVESLPTVGWVGTYHPAYKVDTTLQSKTGETKMAVYAYDNPQQLANKLKNIGTIVDTEGSSALNKVYIVTDASNIPAIAQLDEVSEIYFQAELQTLNNRAGEVEGNHYLWDTTLSGLPMIITGIGIRVGIQDTGWDDGDEINGHWDFTRGPLGSRMVNSEQDGDQHGTHCTGIVAGNGYCMEDWLGLDNMNQVYHEEAASNPGGFGDLHGFAGVAPEATVESHAPLGTGDWATMNANGCVVISNSWGPGGAPAANYDSDSNSADGIMAGNDNILVIFAAGNSGPGPLTISGGGNSWNGLSVAASENFRPEGYASSDDPNQLIEFSSRGPMTSGRIKPDISGVGTAVYSTKPASGAFDEYSDIYRENLVDIYGPDGTADYIEMSGTSMACPHIAGHIGLVNQYLRDIDGMASPNRALVKGILLNGAIDMGYGYPNFQSGWGRVNVKNSLIPDAPRTNQWAEGNLDTGQTWDFTVDGGANTYVQSDRVPLKIMLNWDMPAGAAMSNDYELVVESPSGVIYKGNCFMQTPGDPLKDWSYPDPTFTTWDDFGSPTAAPYGFDFDTDNDNNDDINNVEAVFIEKPEIGTWIVTVDSDSTPNAPNFALTWGADTGAIDPYKVEMTTQYPTVFSAAIGGTASFPFNILNFGTNPDSISFTDDADADLTVTYSETSPLALASNEDRSILMQVNVDGAAAVGVHTFTITAISLNDPSSPPTQDSILVKCEVLAEALPFTYQVTTNEMSQYGPSVVAFTDQGGTDHVIIAYASEEQILNGNRVYMKHTTSDLTAGGPATWTKTAVSTNYDSPGDIRITHMPSGTYEDRVFISWNGWDPSDFTDYEGAWAYCSWADPPY
ncbi:MAG: S8 family serine peptidase, partial [Thermoplasmata archaeon]|nr:S8 family serine peptidase [Thermoplasmata archaeon]